MILEFRLITHIIFLMQWAFLLLTFKSLQIAIAMFCPALSHLPFGKSTKKDVRSLPNFLTVWKRREHTV